MAQTEDSTFSTLMRLPYRPAARYSLYVYLGVSVIGWFGVVGFLFGQRPPTLMVSSAAALIIFAIVGVAVLVLQCGSVMIAINATRARKRLTTRLGQSLFELLRLTAAVIAFVLTLYSTIIGTVLAGLFLPLWF